MMNKIIACLLFFLVYCAQNLSSQSRFHIEVDYHYMFGLSEKGEIANFSRNEFKMYGIPCTYREITSCLMHGRPESA